MEKSPTAEPGEGVIGGGNVLKCRACRFKITYDKARVRINDAHQHTFFNPHGLVFNLGCFAYAPGCGVFGSPTSEFTWFPGRTWRIAVCRGCQSHLGWYFSNISEGSAFFGLILDMLVEDSEE